MSQNGEKESISSSSNIIPIPIDLKKFAGEFAGDSLPVTGGERVELSLGLSLNGCFGTEPKNRKISRSSSISTLHLFSVEHNNNDEFEDVKNENNVLERTCSLPIHTEEEVRKRKERQSLKRLDAKRKRFEKIAGRILEENGNCKNNNYDDYVKGEISNGDISDMKWKLNTQVSIGSQGSSSSGLSDFESRSLQEVKSPSLPASHTHTNIKRELNEPSSNKKGCALKRNRSNGAKEMQTKLTEEIPTVYTKLDGPNGRRIQGFLYKYKNGEEVRIVCVCHGSFLTPAEFVKHAGGGDVAHPLRHIVVNPTPYAFW